MSIIDLQEVSQNAWNAKYRGNYGTYTIKIKTDGTKTVNFSCSCPSSGYPCKHIPMVEEAIRERIAKCKERDDEQEITIEQLLKDVPQKELYDFIVRHAQHNPQLKNVIRLEFAHTIKNKYANNVNNYNQLIQDALDGLYFDYEDIEYDYDSIEIDVLDQWLDKAQNYVNQGEPDEAILICKACIEEYATWLEESDCEVIDYIDPIYTERPFDILVKTISLPEVNNKELFDYCKSEMQKPKYKGTEMTYGFNTLFMKLSVAVGSDDFIALQDNLLKEITDKSSYEAERILEQKIDFYRENNQPDKADDVIKENLQIESFREKLTKKLIAENNLQEAKKLIKDFISKKENETGGLHSWHELQLQIAQKENNIPEIRLISYLFIEAGFNAEYYNIYKSTFAKEEWEAKAEKLINHYEKRLNTNWFNSSLAKVLQAEKQEERLLKYIEKYLSIGILEKYHTVFAASFPEKTLSMFRRAIDKYAQNTGREIYEQIVKLFGKMVKIEGGSEVVKDMISQYRIVYKNRRAMMEILNGFKQS